MRVLVCGGRNFKDWQLAKDYLDRLHAEVGITCVIHGGARGADEIAEWWAGTWAGIESVEFPAAWHKHGKAAGPKRNQQMIDDGKPELVVAFPGGQGTADMVRRAKSHGIQLRELTP